MITNSLSGTQIDEVARGIYRISTPTDAIPGGFSFNSYLVVDDEPILFHTGWRKLFPLTQEAIATVMPIDKLRWIGGSHFEGDEFGALNDFLSVAPVATPFGSQVGVMISLNDYASREARGLADDLGERCHTRSDHGCATGHGLNHGQAERLRPVNGK